MKKVLFEINGWAYSISVEDSFATYLQPEISKDFQSNTPDSRKAIIHAYIKAKYKFFNQEKAIETIVDNLTQSL